MIEYVLEQIQNNLNRLRLCVFEVSRDFCAEYLPPK